MINQEGKKNLFLFFCFVEYDDDDRSTRLFFTTFLSLLFSDEICPGLLKDDALNTSVGLENDLSSIIDNEEAYYSINSNNVSIELDHNYSYMKQKIDKSILATPKSVVKADKDGGFLKVLSEIALVKAEADNRSGDKKDDEDKENKIVCIPEIRVTEATPEKPTKLSPSQKINMPFRRFKIIYNSPKCSDNFDFKQRPKARSFTETSENNNNNIYKRLDKEDINNSCYAETENKVNIIKKSKRHSLPNSMDFCNTTVDLTDFKSDSSALKDKINIEFSDSLKIGASEKNELQVENKISDSEILANKELTSKSEEEPINCFLNDPKTIRMDEAGDVKENSLVVNKPLLANHSLTCASSEKSKSCLMHTNLEVNNGLQNTENDDEHMKTKMQENFNSSEALTLDTTKSSNAVLSPEQVSKHNNIPPNYRFSKEARKIVEALKSSAFDDTLNFTIPEIDLEDIEDSFTTPKPSKSIPSLDQTIDDNNMLVSDIKPQGKNVVNRTKPWKTVPKDYNNKPNPSKCADKVEPLKYFSDRKMQTGMTSQVKKCVKKLPYDEKALVGTKGEFLDNINLTLFYIA